MVLPLVWGAVVAGRLAYMGYRAYKAYKTAKRLKDLADKAKKAKELADKAKKAKEKCKDGCKDPRYKRPSKFRKGVRDEVYENAKKDGKVTSPDGKEIKPGDKWDMGHKPGQEFRKHQQSAAERDLSRKEFLNEHNNPQHYRPETPSYNRSHQGEIKDGPWLGM